MNGLELLTSTSCWKPSGVLTYRNCWWLLSLWWQSRWVASAESKVLRILKKILSGGGSCTCHTSIRIIISRNGKLGRYTNRLPEQVVGARILSFGNFIVWFIELLVQFHVVLTVSTHGSETTIHRQLYITFFLPVSKVYLSQFCIFWEWNLSVF